METRESFTQEQWARHQKFVNAFREAKKRKQEWQERMNVFLSEREERIRLRRKDMLAIFNE
ncbi:MAG: hypothetical protein IJ546_05005 [Prevotella sp.]|nr:hypothetical protein [Prevotella sp.]MBR1840318.1 hypothetical protein [Prevotella sp.]